MDWLLNLDRINWSDPRAGLSWRYALDGWQWVLVVLAAMILAGGSYRHLLGPRYVRLGLTVVRALLLLLVVMLLLGPVLTVMDEQIEEDWLIMLVDRSESMSVQDALVGADGITRPRRETSDLGGGSAGTAGTADDGRDTHPTMSLPTKPNTVPVSRDAALRRALAQQGDLFTHTDFMRHRRILWLGFDQATYAIEPRWDKLGAPVGQATFLRSALEQAMRRAAGRPVAGIVLMTDGRTSQSTGTELLRRLRGVPVFPVAVGGDVSPLNFSLRRVDAPAKAFIHDDVPVAVWVEHDPVDAQVDRSQVRLSLIDADTDRVLDEKYWADRVPDEPVILTGRSGIIGPANWRVQVQYQPPTTPGTTDALHHSDPRPKDNVQTVHLELLDQATRVLYVEGYPRWEYRFLKNLLVRERTINSSIFLISADRDFAQEGDNPILRLPASAQDWAQYDFDVVILGDVPPDYLSSQQMAMLRDHVAVRGAGLLWIGGPYHTPGQYEATILADMLPMRMPAGVQRAPVGLPITMYRWPQADALNVLQLRDPDIPSRTWPPTLPPFAWVQDIGLLKPAAEILAASAVGPRLRRQTHGGTGVSPVVGRDGRPTAAIRRFPTRPSEVDEGNAHVLPLVVAMRYGAGQSIYLATDETWRWRQGRGQVYFGQFWIGLIRMLARQRLQHQVDGAHLDVSHRRPQAGRSIVVSLDIDDARLLERDLSSVEVVVYREDQPDRQLERLQLHAGAHPASTPGTLPKRPRYRANWKPASVGRLLLRVVEPALDHLEIRQTIEVVGADSEMRRTTPDHQRLVNLARDTNGKMVPLHQLDQLALVVPHVARATPNDRSEPLWNSPLTLIVVLMLLTMEWIGRKMIRLV